MRFSKVQRDWEVFVEEGKPGIGAVRQVAADHILVYIEGFGDVRLREEQVISTHDGKVIIAINSLSEDVQAAIRHAHDREPQ